MFLALPRLQSNRHYWDYVLGSDRRVRTQEYRTQELPLSGNPTNQSNAGDWGAKRT